MSGCRFICFLVTALLVGLLVGHLANREDRRTAVRHDVISRTAVPRLMVPERRASQAGNLGKTVVATVDPALRPDFRTVARYLEHHRRNPSALMAAGLVLGDDKLLREAAAVAPERAHIQLLVLARNLFPEERAEWVHRFKQSQPANALASLLSAELLLREGKVEESLAELRTGLELPQFDDFSRQSILAREEVWISSGKPPGEAAFRSMADEALHRPVAHQLQNFARAFLEGSKSVTMPEDVTERIGLASSMGRKLSQEGTRGFAIDRLIGLSIEQEALGYAEVSPYADLTLGEAQAQVEADITHLVYQMRATADVLDPLEVTDTRLNHFVDRVKLFGHAEAFDWLLAH